MFKFKGISSEEMRVVIEEEEHFIGRASKRYNTIEIEGKDGAIFEELGYSVIERNIKVQCLDITKIDEILAWLDGEGEFEYKDRITKARFYSELSPERKTCIRIIETNFIRDPFWTKKDDNFETVTNTIKNNGNIDSRPILRLEKQNNDEVELTINDVRFKYKFNNENYVEIDCEEKNAYYNKLIRNKQLEIDYKFPLLKVGNNSLIFNSGTCVVKVKRKDRWL